MNKTKRVWTKEILHIEKWVINILRYNSDLYSSPISPLILSLVWGALIYCILTVVNAVCIKPVWVWVSENHILLFLLYCPVLANTTAVLLSDLTFSSLCPFILTSASLFTSRRYCNSRFRQRSTEPWTRHTALNMKRNTSRLWQVTRDGTQDLQYFCISISCDRYFKTWNILKRSADTLWDLWCIFVWILKKVPYISTWKLILFVDQVY